MRIFSYIHTGRLGVMYPLLFFSLVVSVFAYEICAIYTCVKPSWDCLFIMWESDTYDTNVVFLLLLARPGEKCQAVTSMLVVATCRLVFAMVPWLWELWDLSCQASPGSCYTGYYYCLVPAYTDGSHRVIAVA